MTTKLFFSQLLKTVNIHTGTNSQILTTLNCRDVPIRSQKLCIGANQGIFKWSVSAILSTNLSLILCFTSAVTQALLLAKLSCTATQWVQPLLTLRLSSTPLSSVCVCVASDNKHWRILLKRREIPSRQRQGHKDYREGLLFYTVWFC